VPIIYGFILLFVLRTLQRVIHQGELFDTFGITTTHNVGNMVFFAAWRSACTCCCAPREPRTEVAAHRSAK